MYSNSSGVLTVLKCALQFCIALEPRFFITDAISLCALTWRYLQMSLCVQLFLISLNIYGNKPVWSGIYSFQLHPYFMSRTSCFFGRDFFVIDKIVLIFMQIRAYIGPKWTELKQALQFVIWTPNTKFNEISAVVSKTVYRRMDRYCPQITSLSPQGMRVFRQYTVPRAEVMFVTIQRENIRPSKKEMNKAVTMVKLSDVCS
jgi:hypothetical protein